MDQPALYFDVGSPYAYLAGKHRQAVRTNIRQAAKAGQAGDIAHAVLVPGLAIAWARVLEWAGLRRHCRPPWSANGGRRRGLYWPPSFGRGGPSNVPGVDLAIVLASNHAGPAPLLATLCRSA